MNPFASSIILPGSPQDTTSLVVPLGQFVARSTLHAHLAALTALCTRCVLPCAAHALRATCQSLLGGSKIIPVDSLTPAQLEWIGSLKFQVRQF
jgi:hypothetical protein